MTTSWPTENVVADYRDLQATTMAVDQTGSFAVLAGRRALVIVDLDRPVHSIRKHLRQSKWEVGAAEWNPTSLKRDLFAITCNQRAELIVCKDGDIVPQTILRAHTRVISGLNWSPFESHCLATCSVDTYVHIWDIRDPRKPVLPLCAVAGASQVKWNKARKHLLATSHDGDIRLWDERKGTSPVQYISAHLSKIHGLDWCPIPGQDFQLATSSQDCTVKFWDVCNHCRPINILASNAPVWRARYTPFGDGLITVVVPQLRRGENSLLLWNTNSVMAPVHSFVGHNDVVLEFQWRENHGNSKEYQLITWSKDQSLRIWQIDEYLQKLCGHDLETDDNVEKASLCGLESLDYKAANLGQSSFASSQEADRDTPPTPARPNLLPNYLGVIPSPREESTAFVCQSESDKTDNTESRDSITSEIVQSAQPNNLYQEFKLLNRDIPNVLIEEMDASSRTCVFMASSGKNKVWIMLTFPPNYPINAAPSMTFCKGTTVGPQTKEDLQKVFQATCQQHVKNNLSCLEPCIRNIANALANFSLMEQKELSDAGVSYNADSKLDYIWSLLLGTSQHAMGNVPFPRTCGATFCGARFLVCFSRPTTIKRIKSSGTDATPKSLSPVSAYIGGGTSRSQHIASSEPSLGYGFPTIPLSMACFMTDSMKYYVYSVLKHKLRGKLKKDYRLFNTTVVAYDISKLLPIGKELAERYVIDNRNLREMCQKNMSAAISVGRKDLVSLWSLISLTANPALIPNPDPNVGMPWAKHPFGRKLFESLINHYSGFGDIQTVAMLCCALSLISSSQSIKKSSSVIDSITVSPGGSPYHTIHTGDTILDGCSLGALLKSNRSNSWSDCLDDYDGRHNGSNIMDAKDVVRERHENCTKMFDPKLTVQYDEFKRIYAEILYQWNLLEARAEVMKRISSPIKQFKRIEFEFDCTHCLKKAHGPICGGCKNYSFQCAICRIAIRGAFNYCQNCGHGGHAKHMFQWFQLEVTCPTGCGCVCPIDSFISDGIENS